MSVPLDQFFGRIRVRGGGVHRLNPAAAASEQKGSAPTMPSPRDQFRFEFDLAGVRANPGLLEDLVEIYQTALAELRRWDDRRHAALIAQLEELHTLAQRELRYRRSREQAAAELAAGSHRWRRWLRARRPA